MKKKFLSLMMAAAVVATTSVSAFADTTINKADNTEPTTEVTITGNVLNQHGQEPVGTFNVTIPTAAAFTVNQSGKLEGTTINIKNNGPQSIDVYAEKFVDTTRDNGITVVAENTLKSNDKTKVSLKLSGSENTVYLKSEPSSSDKGLYKNNTLADRATEEELKLTSIQSSQNKD